MVLVPHDNIQRLTETAPAVQTVQTTGTPLSRLDAEMSDILNSDSFASERDKCTAYMQILQRYLQLVTHPPPPPPETVGTTESRAPLKSETASKDAPIASRLNDTIIIDSVPKKFRTKASLLLKNLHRNAPTRKLAWDRKGVVSINGVRIPNSNIVDLVNDAMRARKREKPAGRAHFARLLRRIQMPREFIGNTELLREAVVASTPRRRVIIPDAVDEGSGEDDDGDGDESLEYLTDVAEDDSNTIGEEEEEEEEEKATSGKRKQAGKGRRVQALKKTKKKLTVWTSLKL